MGLASWVWITCWDIILILSCCTYSVIIFIIREYPSFILIIFFAFHSPSIVHPDEIPVKVLYFSRVWNEMISYLKGEHEYDPPVCTIRSHGFCITNSNTFRVLEVIYLLVNISFPPSFDMARSSSTGAHGWQNVSFYNHMGWRFMLYIWGTGSSRRYLLISMIYHKIDPGVGFARDLV